MSERREQNDQQFDVAIIGAGAAGLIAAIWAGRTAREQGRAIRTVVLDGAKKLGAKILVAGGGRCNVTHHEVDEDQFAGSSRHAIRKVLLQFNVRRTVEFFSDLGVELKREDTGKLFPVTDDANTVLNALVNEVGKVGAELRHPWRVAGIERDGATFVIKREQIEDKQLTGQGHIASSRLAVPMIRARRVILATGGRALPRTGSDGAGYAMARSLGHTITPRVFPGLVPLTLPKDHWLCGLAGIAVPATIELRLSTGKKLREFTNSVLCTHFGLSGPGVLDMSRHYTAAKLESEAASAPLLTMNWLPGSTAEQLDRLLVEARGMAIGRWLTETAPIPARLPGHGNRGLPERLARALCERTGVDASMAVHALTREQRRAIVNACIQTPLAITGDRGYTFAEVTAGGVPLGEVHLESMESRVCPGLHLCGEILDVDGRIGGFNFQWAWASGFVAGVAVAG